MKFITKTLITTAPLLLCAASAWASATGIAAIDTPINETGRIIGGVGYGVGVVSVAGLFYHLRSGWAEMTNWVGKGAVTSAAAIHYSEYAPILGGSAAALIHPVATHPATHAVIHATSRLLG